MSDSATTHDRLLDAFARLLIDQGERAATLDAVAAEAGVSKGGLLYHFASKQALVDGLLDRLSGLVVIDLERMRAAPAGPIDYYIRTSVSMQNSMDRTIIATARLAQGAHEDARAALQEARSHWLGVLAETVADPTVANAITLLGDGVYFNSAMGGHVATPRELDELIAVVKAMAEPHLSRG